MSQTNGVVMSPRVAIFALAAAAGLFSGCADAPGSGSLGDPAVSGTAAGSTGAGVGNHGGSSSGGGHEPLASAGGPSVTGGAGTTGVAGGPTLPAADCSAGTKTIDCFYEAVLDKGAQSVAQAMPLLPADVRSGLMLMGESRSRHTATPSNPRIVMYGHTGDLLVGVSSNPADPLYEVMELIELQADGLFKFRQLDMQSSPPTLSADDSSCRTCHGERPRLIWGRYRTWPGLIGDGDDMLRDVAFVSDLKARIPERFGSLIATKEQLPYAPLEWSGELFNYTAARAMGVHLAKIMKASAAYTTAARYALVANSCSGAYAPDVYADLAQFGIHASDTRADLLQQEVPAAGGRDYGYGYYFGGGEYEDQLWEVALVDLVFGDKDAELARILAPFIALFSDVYPLSQAAYDGARGLLPHDLPLQHNGASGFLGMKNGENQYAGYGGAYPGFRLWGYGGAWAGSNSYLPKWLADNPSLLAQLTKDGPVHQEFCNYVTSKR